MINLYGLLFAVVALSFINPAPSFAEHKKASCEQAKDLAIKGAELFKTYGIEIAQQAFLDKRGGYQDLDLYVFVLDGQGKLIIHGGWPNAVGLDIAASLDLYGRPYGKEMMRIKDAGWVHYIYADPSDQNRIKDKSSYVLNIKGYRLGVGCYHDREAKL